MNPVNLPAAEVIAMALRRGYSREEIAPCIVRDLGGGRWLVDVKHPAYPHDRSRPPPPDLAALPGPGAALKKMLAGWPFRITSSPTCKCNYMASKMDEWGPDECSKPERIGEVVSVMRQEAAKRGIVFSETVAKMLVRAAIRRSRKKTKESS